MMKRMIFALCSVVVATAVAFGDAGRKTKGMYAEPQIDKAEALVDPVIKPSGEPDWSRMRPLVGTYTTLSGYYDYQSNGGALQYIRVNPANGNIHVTYMIAEDSTANLNNSRRVAYAMSTNGGITWNNFGNVRIPTRRAGYPSIDLGQGPIAGGVIIADHSAIGAGGQQGTIFVDYPEGGGAFGEVAPPTGFGSDEPEWPSVAGASDGSVVMAVSRNTANTVFYTRTVDFVSWSPYAQIVGAAQSGGKNPVQSNGTGRVGILANTSNGTTVLGNWWLESTNNGQTWTTPVNMFASRYDPIDGDTLNSSVHCDFVYSGNTPLFVFSEYSNQAWSNRQDIVFWSQATGFKVCVPYDSLRYGPYNHQDNPQRFHNWLTNFPSIGLSGNTIIVTYQAFQPDTDRLGWNYSDLWYVTSGNGGSTWSTPQRITNTRFVDERYPSISKWNPPGLPFKMVWSQKTGASGLYAFPGSSQAPGADTVRAYQVFLTGVIQEVNSQHERASGFRLGQNYPNPFNPATRIDYVVAAAGRVSITVYNILGQEVGSVLNDDLQPGTYQAIFDGTRLTSGVYYYRMTARGYTETRRMALVK